MHQPSPDYKMSLSNPLATRVIPQTPIAVPADTISEQAVHVPVTDKGAEPLKPKLPKGKKEIERDDPKKKLLAAQEQIVRLEETVVDIHTGIHSAI
jgi:hypothetical protein